MSTTRHPTGSGAAQAAPEPHASTPVWGPPDADGAAPAGFYASWGRRLTAWLIDVVAVATGAWLPAALVGLADLQGSAGWELAARSFPFVVPFGYYAACHGSSRGQTLGKRVLGIAVRRAGSLGRLGYPRAAARFLVTFAFWLPAGLLALVDGLWPLGQRENRALHDLVAGSVVVRV
jgi:uncharacterized RDD family membrane protein YckC